MTKKVDILFFGVTGHESWLGNDVDDDNPAADDDDNVCDDELDGNVVAD
jgi:hypothetical protein